MVPPRNLGDQNMKTIITIRYYPEYRGRRSTRWSYRTWYVGAPRPGTGDAVVGLVPDDTPDGWVYGRGQYPARTLPRALAAVLEPMDYQACR